MSDAAALNRHQAEEWNGEIGTRWVVHQERMDTLLLPFLEAVLRAAAPRAGERALDVGCGCGATTLALARRIGDTGSTLGVDVSSPMLERARLRAAETGSPARFACADAASVPFEPGGFDLLFSRFGVMFFGDPVAAFRHLHAAMKPGGRAAFICWRAASENDWLRLPAEIAAPFLPPLPPADPNAPGPFAFADPDRVAAILTEAGWQAPRLSRFDHRLRLGDGTNPDPAQDALDDVLRAGPLARRLADQPADQMAQALDAVRNELRRHAGPDGIGLDAATWIVEAQA